MVISATPMKYAVPTGRVRIRVFTAVAARYTGVAVGGREGADGLDTHPASQNSGRFCYSFGKTREDHRGIKQRRRPMGGFKSVDSASTFAESTTKCGTFCARVH